MATFSSPSVKKDIIFALDVWTDLYNCSIEDLTSGYIKKKDEYSFSEDVYEDMPISLDSSILLQFPLHDEMIDVSFGKFVDIAKEVANSKFYSDSECFSDSRYLLHIQELGEQTNFYLDNVAIPEPEDNEDRETIKKYVQQKKNVSDLENKFCGDDGVFLVSIDKRVLKKILDEKALLRKLSSWLYKSTMRYLSIVMPYNDETITCSIVKGITVFNVLAHSKISLSKDSIYDVMSYDYFIEIRYEKKLPLSVLRNIAYAYLFELSNTANLKFEIIPYIVPDIDEIFSQDGYSQKSHYKFRPLMLGKGLLELQKLFNKAITAHDNEIKIFFFTQVIEYVSATVVSLNATEIVRAKLQSSKALDPDAEYVKELIETVENQRVFKRDREAIKSTFKKCCDAKELNRLAPPFLDNLENTASQRKQEQWLEQLGFSLYSTRNSIAHAKANYEATGKECPVEQYDQFSKCLRVACEQVIRWYSSQHESVRVI